MPCPQGIIPVLSGLRPLGGSFPGYHLQQGNGGHGPSVVLAVLPRHGVVGQPRGTARPIFRTPLGEGPQTTQVQACRPA